MLCIVVGGEKRDQQSFRRGVVIVYGGMIDDIVLIFVLFRGTFGRPDDRPAHVLRSFGKTGIRVFGISAAHFNTTEVTSNVLRYFHKAKA